MNFGMILFSGLSPLSWWLLVLLIAFVVYSLILKTGISQRLYFAAALITLFIIVGSSFESWGDWGLHTPSMVLHILAIIVLPIFLWQSAPADFGFRFFTNSPVAIISAWILAAVAMWSSHFISASQIAAETGVTLCGITTSPDSWAMVIPSGLLTVVLIFAGVIFAQPVFHPNSKYRMHAMQAALYLFLSCTSCVVLGMWVTFTATGSSFADPGVEVHIFGYSWLVSHLADQQLAGLMMWVPACLIHTVAILDRLYDYFSGADQVAVQSIKVAPHAI